MAKFPREAHKGRKHFALCGCLAGRFSQHDAELRAVWWFSVLEEPLLLGLVDPAAPLQDEVSSASSHSSMPDLGFGDSDRE